MWFLVMTAFILAGLGIRCKTRSCLPYTPEADMPDSLWRRQVLALIIKEYKQIVRDPSSWLVAVGLPIIFLLLFGYGINLDAGVMDFAVIDESRSARSLRLAAAFAHSPSFRVLPAGDRLEAEHMMRDSTVRGMLVIPRDFEAGLEAGRGAPLQLLVDGAEPNTAKFISAYAQGVIENWQATEFDAPPPAPVSLESRYWYNPAALSPWFLIPGSITIIMTLIGVILTALVIAREWERGTMEAMFATPVSRMQLLLGKLIPYFCLGMASMSLCALAASGIFGVPFRGSVGALVLISALFMLTSLGQGLLISVLARNQLLAAQAALFSGFLPAMILSGFVFDINSMPFVVQQITRIVPARYFKVCLQTRFLTGDGWEVFVPHMACMGVIALVFLALVYRNFVKRLR
jgi:ABC-2 type transport system permease protein